jgi:hypothetical protein
MPLPEKMGMRIGSGSTASELAARRIDVRAAGAAEMCDDSARAQLGD